MVNCHLAIKMKLLLNRLELYFAGDYVQNKCNSTDPSCEPCPKRLPLCVGLPDGKQVFPGKLFAPDYIECQQNRTMGVKKCHLQYFNPQVKDCRNYSRRKYYCYNKSRFCELFIAILNLRVPIVVVIGGFLGFFCVVVVVVVLVGGGGLFFTFL